MDRLSEFRNRMRMAATVCTVCTACCVLLSLAACSDDTGTADACRLPAGQYPMTFTTSVDGLTPTCAATRATTCAITRAPGTADGAWTSTDRIAVQVGDAASGGEIKEYAPSAINGNSATLTSDAPFYWQTSGETKTVSAWYCGDGSTAASGRNAGAVPASWAVKANQSVAASTGTPDAYQQSDFLYAAKKDIRFSDADKSLTFAHQTARVVINIVKAEAATDAGAISAVIIGNTDNLALSGTYTAPAQGQGQGSGATVGTWNITSGTAAMGTITPKDITPASGGSGILKTYAALVIPQNMSGKKFIAVTLTGGNTYYYTPTSSDADLQSGNQYTYDIIVKHGYLEVVTAKTDGAWGGDGTTDPVTSKIVAEHFTADDLKIGDYFYRTADGGWATSDGGLRKIYTDGSIAALDIMPVLTDPTTGAERTCIGIVYWVGREALDEDPLLKDKHSDCTHGLVVALQDASYMHWSNEYEMITTAWINQDGNLYKGKVDLRETNKRCGYSNTLALIDYNAGNYSSAVSSSPGKRVLPVAAIQQYADAHPAPTNSSGWYFPSIMELKYVCWGQGNSRGTSGKDYLKTNISKAGGTLFGGGFHWSSTEYSDYSKCAWNVDFNGGEVNYGCDKDHNTGYVRPLLAF